MHPHVRVRVCVCVVGLLTSLLLFGLRPTVDLATDSDVCKRRKGVHVGSAG